MPSTRTRSYSGSDLLEQARRTLAVAKAVQALQSKNVNRIILTRPAVEAGERLGFLPGSLSEKDRPPTCDRCTTRCTT